VPDAEKLALIVAYARNRVIGRGGDLPWHYREDLQHFKRVTMGHPVLMGRKTYESIGRPLPGRRNLVITRQADFAAPGCEVFSSLEAAVASARTSDDLPFVIGGAAIYALALPLATHLYVTEIQAEVEGDTWFPALDESAWEETERRVSDDGLLVFRTLIRRAGSRGTGAPI
jgi:dihydrofolate reductase